MNIAVAGNIGAGKSTLVSKLAKYYHSVPVYEAVDQNPYLEDFYQDMHQWALPLQIRFLTLRFQQALMVQSTAASHVIDRTIYEDAGVFAKNLYQNGFLNERDYQTYLLLYRAMLPMIQPPDVLIYLQGAVSTLTKRIDRRNLEKEVSQSNAEVIPIGYLNELNMQYDKWVRQFDLCPVLTVTIENEDLNKDEHFSSLTEMIDSI